MSNGHGNHWECLSKPVEDTIQSFIPATIARGQVGESVRRVGMWFDRDTPSEETVRSVVLGDTPLGSMVLLVTDSPRNRSVLYSAYPCALAGAKQHLTLREIRDWGNEVEAVLVGETPDGIDVAFFDTRYFLNRDHYRIGDTYDFDIAGLIYAARCTNDETITVTDQERIAAIQDGMSGEPERLPDGSLAPLVIHLAGCTGYAPTSNDYAEDAEFYCVIGSVVEFDLEGIRIFQITPESGEPNIPLPGVIFGAVSAFKDGYLPRLGDSIGGRLWTQGYLKEPRSGKSMSAGPA